MSILIGMCFLLVLGCERPDASLDAEKESFSSISTKEKNILVDDLSKSVEAGMLKVQGFSGEILFALQERKEKENEFHVPVYLKNASKENMIDTITLKTGLPEGVRLKKVITPSGYTAQLDGIESDTPVVYYHSFAVTPDAYSPVISRSDPIFTLVYTGTLQGNIAVEGAFFQMDGTLLRTNKISITP
jgi:hypothetical protein